MGDRHQQNGVNYTLDLNAGLTQVLSDGTNTYLYGNGRVAQAGSTTEYFLADALGSVRQLADPAGAVTLTQSYAPYGDVVSSVGTSQTDYAFTGENFDVNGLTYLRARYLDNSTGRFTQRDPSGLEANLYLYAGGNPINRIDPSGLYSSDLIERNIPVEDFFFTEISHYLFEKPRRKERWGFYALLLDAQDFDYVRVGSLDLVQLPNPVIGYSKTELIWTVNCDTVMIGSRTLKEYYETEVKRERSPWIFWRDTSARYYQLRNEFEPTWTYVDGSLTPVSDYPDYHSVSIGVGAAEFNIIVDINGNFHLSIPFPGVKGSVVYGIGYTESYIGNWRGNATPSTSEVTELIDGFCASGNIIFGGGISIAPICAWPTTLLNPSAVETFYYAKQNTQ